MVQGDHAAGGHRGVDARLRSSGMEEPGRPEASQMRAKRIERPPDRRLDAGEGLKRPVIQIVTRGHPIVVREDDERIAGGLVPFKQISRGVTAVGVGRVAVELGFAVVAGDRVRVRDPGGIHAGMIRERRAITYSIHLLFLTVSAGDDGAGWAG